MVNPHHHTPAKLRADAAQRMSNRKRLEAKMETEMNAERRAINQQIRGIRLLESNSPLALIKSENKKARTKFTSHNLQLTSDEAKHISRLASRLEEGGWNEKEAIAELRMILGDAKRIKDMLSFLSNFYHVYEQRYREERQLQYMETIKNMMTYVTEETPDVMRKGEKPFCSYIKTLGYAGGIINGAVLDVNAIRKDISGKQKYGNTQPLKENVIVNYIGYICPSKENQKELAKKLQKEGESFIKGIGLSGDYTVKELAGTDDFECGFLNMRNLKVVPGMRIVEAIYSYYPDGVAKINTPQNLVEEGCALYLAIQPLKNSVINDSKKSYIPYEHARAIVEAEYGYRMLQDIKTVEGKEALKVFVDYALQNVKTKEINGVQYAELVTLAKAEKI